MVATPGTARTVRRIRSIMLNHVRPFVILTAGGRLIVGIASGRLLDKMQGIAVIMGTTPLSASAFISHEGPPPASKNPPERTGIGGDRSGKILPSNGTNCHHDGQQLALDSFMILTTSSTRHQRPELDAIAARLPLLTARPSPCSTNRHAMPPAVMRCTFSTSSNRTSQTAGNRQRWFLVPASSRIYDATATAWHPFAGFLAFSRKER